MISLLLTLFKILRIVTIKQLIICNQYKLPFSLKFLGYCLTLVFTPISLFKKPKEDFGARLIAGIEILGPIYIKFGQAISTRPDIIGTMADHLKLLQDKLQPFATNIVKQNLEKSFTKTLGDLFLSFDEIPVAAASISQVHKAEITTGEFVAVKILRPNIHKQYKRDITTLYCLAKILERLFVKLRRLKLTSIIDVFNETMKFELDLRLEAAAASELSDNFTKNLMDRNIYIPKIYWDYTTEDILTTEWIDGISIYDVESTDSIKSSKIAQNFAVMFFNQVFRDGFFHADLHPGNILVTKDSKIVLLDFGIMGRLAEKDRFAIAESIYGFFNRDYKLIAQVHLQAGYIPKNTNLELFAQSCRAVSEPIIGTNVKNISIGKVLGQLFKITEDFGMEVQPQLLLLQKTIIMVEGAGHILSPEINMWQLAEPWMRRWASNNLTPWAKIMRLIKNSIQTIC